MARTTSRIAPPPPAGSRDPGARPPAGTYTVNLATWNALGIRHDSTPHTINVWPTPPTPNASFIASPNIGTTDTWFTFAMQPGIRQDETVAWDFDGDGVVDDTAHSPYASHVFSTSGVFTVTLTLTNPAGVSDSVYRTVFVEDAVPVASFTPSSFIGRAPYTINFTNQTTGHVVAWAWDFDGDGVTDSQAESPSFTYTVDGTFNATLIASNDTGDSTFSVVITILPELQLQ